MDELLFDEKTIQSQFEDFFEIADQFCIQYNKGQKLSVEIDPSLLYLTVVAIYDDIARYKAYHLQNPVKQKANPVKRAAYAVKWIMHFTPLIFPKLGHTTGQELPGNGDVLANAMFSMHIALMNLRAHTGVNFNLQKETHFELIYDLLYRGLTSDSLILYFDTISQIVLARSIDPIIEM